MWADGLVFTQILPSDYLKKSLRIKTKLVNIELRALQPLDIVVTKIGRLDERDLEDIKTCMEGSKLSKRAVVGRARKTQYAGNQSLYDQNLETVKTIFFPTSKKKPDSLRLARTWFWKPVPRNLWNAELAQNYISL